MTAPVILIEFNELCPPLMQRFLARDVLPNFRRFHDEAQVYNTEAAERPPYLEPWIQWITVHTGLTYEEHQVYNLGDAHKLDAPAVWDVLASAGLRVWICGSMNPSVRRPFDGALLPDPWSSHIEPQPRELGAYYKLVQQYVQEYTNDRVPLGARDFAAFATFMARHGLSRQTISAVARQLWTERRSGGGRWKRAAILDRMQMDVFRHYWKKLQPQFATFFSNSTAHFQHMYWRNMDPQLFKVAPSEKDQREYSEAIEFGYRSMDRMLGEFMALAPDATLVFATALSQQPCTIYEEQGGKVAFRPKNFEALLRWAGVEGRFTISPVMTHYFHANFDDEGAAAAAAEKLRALTAVGTQALHVDCEKRELFIGCRIYRTLPETEMIRGPAGEKRFFELFYQIEGLKSGMHHPDGMLWIRTPDHRHAVHDEKVPLARVAPMLLDMFQVARPKTMRAEPLRIAAS